MEGWLEMSQMQVHRSVCVFESVFVTVSVEVFSYEEKEGQVPVSRSVVVSSGHMGEPWGHEMSIQLFSTEHICQMQNKLLFTEQKCQILILIVFHRMNRATETVAAALMARSRLLNHSSR